MKKRSGMMLRSERNVPFHDAVRSAFADALPLCMEGLCPKSSRFQEPDYVAGIVKNIPRMLEDKLPSGLKLGGCYIHKSPLVAFSLETRHKCCEIGDLLVLYRETKNGAEKFNSVLFQFKRSDVDRIDATQFALYSQWPAFNFGRKILDSRERYDIMPKTIHAGAQYNYIHADESLYFTIAEPHKCVVDRGADVRNGIHFEEYLARFVNWHEGRQVFLNDEDSDSSDDQWSRLIRNIYDQTFDAMFMRANIGENRPRGFGERLDFIMKNQMFCDPLPSRDDAHNYVAAACSEEWNGACSILLVDNCAEVAPCFVVG